MKCVVALAMLAFVPSMSAAEAKTICTLIADAADGSTITEQGDSRLHLRSRSRSA